MIKSAFRGRDGEDVMGRPGGAQTDPWSIQTPSLWVDTSAALQGFAVKQPITTQEEEGV